jgi:4-amino-4-deoxy-L-arabinose transferase-like glycosyltransferase
MTIKHTHIILLVIFVVRILCTFLIDKTPCMEPSYYLQGKCIVQDNCDILYLSSLYSILIYLLSTLFNSSFLASSIIFIISSTIVSIYLYLISTRLFGEKAAVLCLLFSVFYPNLTVSIAGYSHTVMIGNAFEFAAIYYLLRFFKQNTYVRLFGIFLLVITAIFIRPEMVLVLLPFYIALFIYEYTVSGNVSLKLILQSVLFYLLIFSSVYMHKIFVHSNSKNKETAGIFSDNQYSYYTFIHTYSLRYKNVIDTDTAITVSEPFIGSPSENRFSISKAIFKNPKQFISNITYNCKELLDYFAHPLFVPFYFYFFIGLLLYRNERKDLSAFLLLGILIVLHIIPLIIFHVEIRYLQSISILILLFVGVGASRLEMNKFLLYTFVFLTFVIFTIYLINNRSVGSLC